MKVKIAVQPASVIAELRNRQFFSIAALNAAIAEPAAQINNWCRAISRHRAVREAGAFGPETVAG
jgi:hypothetical protein